jgi:AsmA protein
LRASAVAEPSLNFDVEIDQLDLDRLLPPKQQPGDDLKKRENPYASKQWRDLSALDELKSKVRSG